jgi:hypothetical protein
VRRGGLEAPSAPPQVAIVAVSEGRDDAEASDATSGDDSGDDSEEPPLRSLERKAWRRSGLIDPKEALALAGERVLARAPTRRVLVIRRAKEGKRDAG